MAFVFDYQIPENIIVTGFKMLTPTFRLADAIDLLSRSRRALTDGVLKGEFAFWLGSGISRERLPNVQNLLLEVMTLLHQNIDAGNSNCPYLRSVQQILQLTSVRDLAPNEAPSNWPEPRRKELLTQLQDKYADVLEQDVRTPSKTISIRWDLLRLDEKYGTASVSPDAEHRFIALLLEEGILSELVTTNWDALVEAAHEKCRAGRQVTLQAIAATNGWSRNGYTSRLIKIHGCAQLACKRGIECRDFLVATRTDIRNWMVESRFEPFKTAFKMILREKSALFIGLSAQDWNIQAECCATSYGQGDFPATPPKVYFAEPTISNSQQAVLKAVYGQDAYNKDPDLIDQQATLPLYAKPLLGTFYLLTIFEKIRLIGNVEDDELKAEHRDLITSVTDRMLSYLVSRYDAIADENQRWRALAEETSHFVSRMLSFYRHRKPPASKEAYEPLSSSNLSKMRANVHQFEDLQWVVFALSVIEEGKHRGLWQVVLPAGTDGKEGQLRLLKGTSPLSVFMVKRDNTGLASLLKDGFVDLATPQSYLIVYPNERKRPLKRTTSPTRALPGAGSSSDDNEIWLRTELDNAAGLGELFTNLKLRISVILPP